MKGYGSSKAGIGNACLIATGLVGSFVLGPLAKKLQRHVEVVKIAFSLSSVGIILLCIFLRETDSYPLILVGLIMFGFFGLGGFPLNLELAAEVMYAT